MAKFLAVKVLGKLQPIDDMGEAVLRRIGQKQIVSIELKRPRNILFHRKFYAMLRAILAAQDHYKSIDDLLAVCKLRIGHTHKIQTAHGIVEVPKSIAFESMDEIAFGNFYDLACQWMIAEVIPRLERYDLDEDVRLQLLEFVANEPEPVTEGV